MAYDYQKLTKQEQIALVEARRQRGYPLHAPPHPLRKGGWYFLTAAIYQHQPVINTPQRRDQLQAGLIENFAALEAEVAGWVILPNHYHILSNVPSLDAVSDALKQLHGSTAVQWNREDGLTGKRRVWYKFADRWVRNERHYYRALNYLHYNPVRHGYVQEPYAWVWSSVHWYLDENGRDWLRSTWREFPVDRMGDGWDD